MDRKILRPNDGVGNEAPAGIYLCHCIYVQSGNTTCYRSNDLSLPTIRHTMIREQESPPKGLVEKRRAQFTQSESISISADESGIHRFASGPISTISLNAQRPRNPFAQENQSSARKVQIDRIRYNLRAPAEILRRSPNDQLGDELGETRSITERLSDGEKRMLRITASKDGEYSLEITFEAQVSDDESTTIPVMRAQSQKSERKRTAHAGRPHQVERFDSKTITIPLPSEKSTGESEKAWAPGWTSKKRQLARDACGDVVAFYEDQGADSDIAIKERELKKARDTIRKKQSLAITKFDPAAIIAECERMMEVLRREGCGDESVSDVDKEIERLKREVDFYFSRFSTVVGLLLVDFFGFP
ncbi:unnamed protein product [Angiostrongylus costaricensis]|uniref:Kinesin motor domain-containing protein n=1 Tax=Angiostrongylus costaricensis TaxID=334426 RepID=A0A158PGT8_ANGCS|nr:unnamed protein product [Angiostrongylus costaricensis]